MAETIRAYFKRRTRRTLQLCAVAVAIAVIAMALFAFGYVLAGGIVGVMAVVISGVGLWYLHLTKCPRCLSQLSATASSARLPHPINFCPYCGANLDSERPCIAH